MSGVFGRGGGPGVVRVDIVQVMEDECHCIFVR